MFFIGQDHIMYTLGDLLKYTYDTKKGVSILFRGASGYGKTELAKKSCNFIAGRDYEFCLGNKFTFNENIFVHLIDEIHLMKEPEILYPIIDEGNYVFIFTTNFDSLLPEALSNRCQNFIFVDYSDDELIDIFKFHSNLPVRNQVIKHIIEIAGRLPRVMVKTFINNLEIHYVGKKNELLEKTDAELIEEIDILFGIEGGLDRISRQYIESLGNLGGRASINLLSSSMKLDINTIKYTVEPALLYKKLIKITSKGRELL